MGEFIRDMEDEGGTQRRVSANTRLLLEFWPPFPVGELCCVHVAIEPLVVCGCDGSPSLSTCWTLDYRGNKLMGLPVKGFLDWKDWP